MQKLLVSTYLHYYRKPIRITTFLLVIILMVLAVFSRKWCHFNTVFSTKFSRCFFFSDFCIHTYITAINMEFIV